MGRKKPTAGADEEEPPVRTAPVGKKNRKKDHVIDDDEYSVATELTDDQEQALMAEQSANGKHQVGHKIDELSGSADDLALSNKNQKEKKGKKLPMENTEEKETGKKKGKKGKKDFQVDDDEFEIGDSVKSESMHAEEAETEITKGKKGKNDFKVDDHEFELGDSDKSVPVQGEEAETGKKKGKKGKKDFKVDDNEFDIGDSIKSESMQVEEENIDVALAGKKNKKSKEKTSKLDAFSLLASYEGEDAGLQEPSLEEKRVEADDESDGIVFTGKKKKKGSKAKATEALEVTATTTTSDIEFSSRVLDETTASSKSTISEASEKLNASTIEEKSMEEKEDEPTIIFSGKKKPKSKKGSTFSSTGFGTIPVEEETSSAAQVPATDNKGEDGFGSTAETQGSNDQPDSGLASKKQKKKKKSGRTAQEEEDLDQILAELGEAPPSTKPAPVVMKDEHLTDGMDPLTTGSGEVEVSTGPTVTIDAEEPEESAAAKKKKKKKEKEKEKKAAAAAAGADEKHTKVIKEEAQDIKSKVSDKKVPKHVREMQERLARLKEAEEKKKREEEERLRKEEEERLRLEELERQKEEAKRRKKEKEKEKLQKKKQEGKLLTGKQKEEARRLALMREQFLSQSGLPTENTGVAKKPRYENKKKKPASAQLDDSPSDKIIEVEEAVDDQHIVPKPEQLDADKIEDGPPEGENVDELDNEPEEENDAEEDEDEWDAKSWDEDVVLPVKSAFLEEESDPMVKKGTKHVMGASVDSTSSKVVTVHPSSTKDGVSSAAPSKVPPVQAKPVSSEKVAATSKLNVGIEKGVENSGEAVETNKRKDTAKARENRKEEALAKRNASDLRSPICCILGHVDTGKTKLLDCIRRTNVQEGEAGGITQQIGATYFPMENIRERTKELKATADLRVPGLLVIDTPGHESFTNLRSRGTSLCDIAILVIDIMHGLEPQTIESLNLLKFRKTPFVVALNKVDRLYGWKSIQNGPIQKALKQQSKDVNVEFETRLSQIVTQLKEQGLNSELYYKNKELARYVSIVPTSAISGEGIPDLLMLLIQLTQKRMEQRLMFMSEIECTVLEVKVIEGLGTTIDVVLVNGVLHEGDQIVVCGMQGPIVTNIRALLTPHPMKELRVKGTYQHHKELKAAQGIKITAQGLEHAIAGTQLYVVGPDDDLEEIQKEAMSDMENIMRRIDKSGEGVCVQASTLGSLEALLEYLKSVKIPVSGINIGPVHKKDVMRASVMVEKKKEYAIILAFDVKVTPEAKELADEAGVKIFMADIIYHLFDQFTAYINNLKEERKKEAADEAVFPCVLKIVPNCVFNSKDPIVLGVDILEGILKVGTPICIPSRDFISIGRIASIEDNHKHVESAKKGQKVAVKIVGSNPEESQKMFGRHFSIEDELVSQISRRSIDVLKENYRDDLTNDEWKLVVRLKALFKIQ